MKPLLNEFLASLDSKNTMKAYNCDINAFYRYLGSLKVDVKDVSLKVLEKYYTKVKREYNGTSVPRKMHSIMAYLKYLVKHAVLERDPTEGLNVRKATNVKLTGGLSNEEVGLILNAVETVSDEFTRLLDRALLYTLFFTGMRRSEVCGLGVSDYNSETNTLCIVAKGNKKRVVPVVEALGKCLQEYLAFRVNKTGLDIEGLGLQPLFVKNVFRPTQYAHTSITTKVQYYGKKAGITRNVHAHMARVTAVSNALDNGVSTVRAMSLGGWSSLDMVLKYDRRRLDLKNNAIHAIDYALKQNKNDDGSTK